MAAARQRLRRSLEAVVGAMAAAEIMLLILAMTCGTNQVKWNEARDLGIPWQTKTWPARSKLQNTYNVAVANTRAKLPPLEEGAAFVGLTR